MELKGLRRAVEDRLRKGSNEDILKVAKLLNIPFLADGREDNGFVNAIPDQNNVNIYMLTQGRVLAKYSQNDKEFNCDWGTCLPDDRGRYLICR
jgi:hypothetical protein